MILVMVDTRKDAALSKKVVRIFAKHCAFWGAGGAEWCTSSLKTVSKFVLTRIRLGFYFFFFFFCGEGKSSVRDRSVVSSTEDGGRRRWGATRWGWSVPCGPEERPTCSISHHRAPLYCRLVIRPDNITVMKRSTHLTHPPGACASTDTNGQNS